jgi:glycosyltransferase involved in cell wall biosynthesis
MQEVGQTPGQQCGAATGTKLPVSVIIPVRNEAKNLPRCLQTLRDAGEVVVVDSQSTDATVEIAREFGAQVVQFHYQGGWPKKRQWAMDTLRWRMTGFCCSMRMRFTSRLRSPTCTSSIKGR